MIAAACRPRKRVSPLLERRKERDQPPGSWPPSHRGGI